MNATLKVVNNPNLEISYQLIDLASVKPSHDPLTGFSKNPHYIYENERLYHMEDASRENVIQCAASLDADHLLESAFPAYGAPIVDQDNNVLGGNGRCMAILFASEKYAAKYEAYKEVVKAWAAENGQKCPEMPILVRKLVNRVSLEEGQRLVSALNETHTKSRSKKADARTRGGRISQRTLEILAIGLQEVETLREFFDTRASLSVVSKLIEDGAILDTEKNLYVNAGYLNSDGKTLIESALRSMIFPSYEALAKMPAPIIAKIDASIPHIIISENISGYSIKSDLENATKMIIAYKSGNYAMPEMYLNQCDMFLGSAPSDFYGKLATALFRFLLESKKADFVALFKRFTSYAVQSTEPMAQALGLVKSFEQAVFTAFGVKLETSNHASEKAETSNQENKQTNNQKTKKGENKMNATITENTSGNANSEKETRKRTKKNDCTKENSTRIMGKEKVDLDTFLDACADIFGTRPEADPISKTLWKIEIAGQEIAGYRIMKTGNRFQLRLLNDYPEYSKQEKAAEIEQPIEKAENDIAADIETNNIIDTFDMSKKQKKVISILVNDYNWKIEKEYNYYLSKEIDGKKEDITFQRNVFGIDINKYIRMSYYKARKAEEWAEWLNNQKMNLHYEKIEIEQEEKKLNAELPIIEKIIAAIFECLIKLGWENKTKGFLEYNFYGGTKGGELNPHGNRIFHIAIHKNEIFLQDGWDNLFRETITIDTDPEKFAREYNQKIVEYARNTGDYDNPETLDGAIINIQEAEKEDLSSYLAMPEYTLPAEIDFTYLERCEAYQEKIQAKRDHYATKSEKLANVAQSQYEHAKEMASAIPLGQPILMDHYSAQSDINYREKMRKLYGKSFENMEKAEYYKDKSENYGTHSVSSDNPDAIRILKEKLQGQLENHEKMKVCNKIIKNKKKTLPAKCEYVASIFPDMTPKEIIYVVQNPYGEWYNGFNLKGSLQEIKRIKERISELETKAENTGNTIEYNLFTYEENIELNRVMLYFPGKPDYATRQILKSHGFKWSPKNRAWQRMLNNQGVYNAKLVIGLLGATIEEGTESLETAKTPETIDNSQSDSKNTLDTNLAAMPEYIMPENYLPIIDNEDTGIVIKEYLGRKTLSLEDRKDKETVIARAKVLNNIRAKDDLIIWKDKDGLYHFNQIEDTRYLDGTEFYIIDGYKYKKAFIPELHERPQGQTAKIHKLRQETHLQKAG